VSANLILGVSGSIVTLTVVFELLRRRHLREKYAVLWVTVALLTLIVATFPRALYWLADLTGVAVPVNLLFFGASMFLLAVCVQLSYEVGRLEDRTRVLGEEIALLRSIVDAKDEA
jgi:hypothetical protein